MERWKNNPFSHWKTGSDFDGWLAEFGLEASPEPAPEFVWVDVETTGLDPDFDVILEIGIVLTDAVGRVIKNGAIVWQVFSTEATVFKKNYATALTEMDNFVRNMHTGSGLLEEFSNAIISPNTDNLAPHRVAWDAVQWLRAFLPEDKHLQLSGSTPHFDRAFLRKDLPILEDWFHYRTGVDVSGIREVAKRVNPSVIEAQPKPSKIHRPLPDLADSIKLYQHLLKNFVILDSRTKEYFA